MKKIGKWLNKPITWIVLAFMCLIGVIVWAWDSIRDR